MDKFQALFKARKVRKYLKTLKDGMTFSLLNKCLDNYRDTILEQKKINNLLLKKKIRHTNFPECISENIVKFAIYKKYNIMPNWDTKNGDLEIDLLNKNIKIEVKGALNIKNGPSSFGPNENWDIIYFIDANNMFQNKFKIYEIKLSNKSNLWMNLKINKSGILWKDFIKTGKRPRMNFTNIIQQFPEHCINKIFDDDLNKLNPLNE